MGRVKLEIDWKVFNSYLELKASKRTCSALLGISETTIEERLREEHNMTFTEYAERMLSPTRNKLVQKALDLALSGNVTMLIFCLKNMCGWADKTEESINHTGNVTLEKILGVASKAVQKPKDIEVVKNESSVI